MPMTQPQDPPLVQQIRALAADGHGVVDIAATIRRTSSHVYGLARKHGIALPKDNRRQRALSKTVITAIVNEAKRRGTTVAEVLLDLGVWADGAGGPDA